MPTLLLTPRFTDDSIAILTAAQRVGWTTMRLYGWRVPTDEIDPQEEIALYGEPLLAAVLGETLPIALLEPTLDWLPSLPAEYRKRDVRLTTLGEARAMPTSAFVKPADDKGSAYILRLSFLYLFFMLPIFQGSCVLNVLSPCVARCIVV